MTDITTHYALQYGLIPFVALHTGKKKEFTKIKNGITENLKQKICPLHKSHHNYHHLISLFIHNASPQNIRALLSP